MPEKADLSNIDEAIKLIAPIISHEVRNPLAIIGNSSYFIKTKLGKDGDVDAKVERHLGIIEMELVHANDVFEKILGYARMPEAKPKAGDLNRLVSDACAAFKNIKTDLPKAGPSVSADADLVVRAIKCVVENAVQAVGGTETADAQGKVKVTVKKEGKTGVVSIEDAGPGLSPDCLDRLFLPFNTTKPRGIGMGLAYARKVLDRHGGKVTSEKAKSGAKFKIALLLA
jgi:nitrogen fixation/metabolism regulation signal transduction histidine kinase